MINVNLLGSKPKVKGVADKGDALRSAGVIIISLVVLAVLFVGIYRFVGWLEMQEDKPLPKSPISSDSTLKDLTLTDEDYSATSLNTIEVPVDEPPVSYMSMNALEKMNYEFIYTHKLLTELIGFIPKYVDFSLMQVDSFTTLTGSVAVDKKLEGKSRQYDSKAEINDMLEQFNESPNWEIRPKPATIIKDRGSFYTFDFRVDYSVPIKERSEIIFTEKSVPLQSQLQRLKKSIMTLSKMSGLETRSSLKRVKADTKGKYKYFYYKLEGDGDFSAVMKFLEALKNKPDPVALEQIVLKAKADKLSFTFTFKVSVL